MGSDAVNHAAAVAGLPERPSTTANLRLHGWTDQPEPFSQPVGGLRRPTSKRCDGCSPSGLAGTNRSIRASPTAWERWPGRPDSSWRAPSRMSWRGGPGRSSSTPGPARRRAAVASVLAAELGRDAAWEAEQVRQYRELADGYRLNGTAVS